MNSEASLKRRIESILAEVENRGFETVVFVNDVYNDNPLNFVYVSGAWGYGQEHAALIFDINGSSTLVIKHWSQRMMEEKCLYDNVVPVMQSRDEHIKGIKLALERFHDPAHVCFDLSTMSGQFTLQMMAALGVSPSVNMDISDHVFRLRGIKDDYEIGEIKKAVRITEGAIVEVAKNAKPGASTAELKKKMEACMMERGAIDFPFLDAFIDISHVPKPSRKIIKHGDLIGIDHGCRVPSGYTCDMNRSIPISPDSELKAHLDKAIEAHREGLKLIRHGATASRVYEEIVKINVGYGFSPIQRGGHQIGLGAHDDTMPFVPNIGPLEEDSQPLKEGMTLCYEPFHWDMEVGYASSFEDVVLVTKGEPVLLTELPWDFLW